MITELRVHTPGGVIGAGVPLMDLVPLQDRLIVTARVRPFSAIGMSAIV